MIYHTAKIEKQKSASNYRCDFCEDKGEFEDTDGNIWPCVYLDEKEYHLKAGE